MSAQSAFVWDESFIANSDLSAVGASTEGGYIPVKLTAQDTVDKCSAASDHAFGILQNLPKAGQAAAVRILGKSKGYSDGSGTTINPGDYVGPNASGNLVKKASADFGVVGFSNGPVSSALGVVIEVILVPQGIFRSVLG